MYSVSSPVQGLCLRGPATLLSHNPCQDTCGVNGWFGHIFSSAPLGLQNFRKCSSNQSASVFRCPNFKLGSSSKLKSRSSIRGKLTEFNAKRFVGIPTHEGAFPAVEYLKETERVVKVTFPDSARITYLGNSVWQARLFPVTFLTISATPVCEVKVFNEDSSLWIHSDKLGLSFSGFTDNLQNLQFQFLLQGNLQAFPRGSNQDLTSRRVQDVKFDGYVTISLKVDLPLPFSLFPTAILKVAGDTILDNILGAMESRLVRGVTADYHSWCGTPQSVSGDRVLEIMS